MSVSGWSVTQRKALIACLIAMSGYLIIRLMLYPMYVSDPPPVNPLRENDLADRIDPNTAEWQTLAAMPIIGEKRARDIIAYREQFIATHPASIAFSTSTDLMNIRGIGTVTMQQLSPFLIFPKLDLTPAPSTQP